MVGEARGVGFVLRLGMPLPAADSALYRGQGDRRARGARSDVDWVIVRPPLFGEAIPARILAIGEDLDVGMGAMSAADVAGALLQAMDDDRFTRKAVEIGY